MRLITELPPKEFFAAVYGIADEAEKYLKLIDFNAIRKNVPELTGEETAEERMEKIRTQGMKNIKEMLYKAMMEHPDETEHFLHQLVSYDKEEMKKLTGIRLMTDSLNAIGDESVISFLSSVLSAAQTVSKL